MVGSAPVKVVAPATVPTVCAGLADMLLTVTTIVLVPVAGFTRYHISVLTLPLLIPVPAEINPTPLYVTEPTTAFVCWLIFIDTPTTSTRLVPVVVWGKLRVFAAEVSSAALDVVASTATCACATENATARERIAAADRNARKLISCPRCPARDAKNS